MHLDELAPQLDRLRPPAPLVLGCWAGGGRRRGAPSSALWGAGGAISH